MKACNCPNCSAELTIDDENRDFAFCQYCGSKILLDDYRSTRRIVDEAKIKQAEIDREIRLRELNIKEMQIARKNKFWKIVLYLILATLGLQVLAYVIGALILLFIFLFA